jgi:imidazole glycerol phosphate synthase subunit HisF
VFEEGRADAGQALHFGTYRVGQIKRFLAGRGIPVRQEGT